MLVRDWIRAQEYKILIVTHSRRGQCVVGTRRRQMRWVNQRTLVAVRLRARSLDSQLERETVGYFLALKETRYHLVK